MKRLVPMLALAAIVVAPGTAGHASAKHKVLDIHHLPLGDGHVSSTPRLGYVMACRLGPERGGGARHAGAWIHSTHGISPKRFKCRAA